MSVGRNDLCPCGSGKKYKRCCLEKNNMIELTTQRRESFYNDKQLLTKKISSYLKRQVPLHEYNQLRRSLIDDTDHMVEKEFEGSFFTYWLHFYHRFDNNLRGIEWFYENNQAHLSTEEKAMLETWIAMEPRFLQAVDVQEHVVIFKDMITEETFPLSKDAENVPQIIPWACTIAMIEPFEDMYYFNGFRFTVDPLQMTYALEEVDRLAKDKQQTKTAIIFESLPQLFAILFNKERMKEEYGRKVAEHAITFDIHDQALVLDFLHNQKDFRIDKWEDNLKEIVWSGNWRIYHDNENNEPLKLADVFGQIMIHKSDTKLTFQTMHTNKIADLHKRFAPLENALTVCDESSETIGYFLTKVHNVLISMDDDMPDYFAIYAQNNIYQEIDTPIQSLDNSTIRECLEQDRRDIAETWLQTTEFNLYKQILKRFGTVEVSADFNTIRKEFNLPLSPFVTGGENRRTELVPIELEEETTAKVSEEDIPYLEALEFTPDSIDTFYADDMLRFYKEKTIDKSEATERKYRNSLSVLRHLLEENDAQAYKECNESFWKNLVTTQFNEYRPDHSKTERTNFISVLRAFLTWVDQTHETDYFKEATQSLRTI